MSRSSSYYNLFNTLSLVHEWLSAVPTLSVEEKIQGFLELPSAWHHGEGTPPNAETVATAIELNTAALDEFLLTEAVPGLDGEVQIVVYGHAEPRETYLEITVESDQAINITRFDLEDGQWQMTIDEDVPSPDHARQHITRFAEEIWPVTSEFSQDDTTMNLWADLQAQPLRVEHAEYRLYESLA